MLEGRPAGPGDPPSQPVVRPRSATAQQAATAGETGGGYPMRLPTAVVLAYWSPPWWPKRLMALT
jgi:hypothetical protein